MKSNRYINFTFLFICTLFLIGCNATLRGNDGQMQSYMVPEKEASWIRNGEPIVFESEAWYPQDDVESLKDSEMLFLGDYRGVQFFVYRVDVRPYERLYTKFGKNKFRYFKRLENK